MTAQQENGIATKAVRGGEAERHGYDAVTVPIVCSATYTFRDSDEIRALFEGRIERHEYGRYGNPTVEVAERKLVRWKGLKTRCSFRVG
jgi:cystathionine gamma-synthase